MRHVCFLDFLRQLDLPYVKARMGSWTLEGIVLDATGLPKLLEIGGIAALSLGILYLLYNAVFAKVGTLGARQSFNVIRLILILVFLTVLAVITFVYLTRDAKPERETYKPSFDCRLATRQAEKIICGSEQLSALDVENAAIFNAIKRSLKDEAQERFETERQLWVASRNSCGDEACVRKKFDERIAHLNSLRRGQ
jgi:hypothetical protein